MADDAQTYQAAIRGILDREPIEVLSFDFFDTLAKRDAHTPVALFDEVGAALHAAGLLAPHVSPGRFRTMRKQAEARAREARFAAAGTHEVSLLQICTRLLEDHPRAFRDGAAPADLLAAEERVEREATWLSPRVVELAEQARAEGLRCIVVSDTYFRAGHLEAVLGEARQLFERIVVSNEHDTGKAGGLFGVALARIGAAPERVLHVGDNYDADVLAPHAHGMHAVLVPNGTGYFWRIVGKERDAARAFEAPAEAGGPDRREAGRAIAMRTANTLLTEIGSEFSYRLFGQAVVGPVLVAFLDWVIDHVARLPSPAVLGLLREGGFLLDLLQERARRRGLAEDAVFGKIAVSRRSTAVLAMSKTPTAAELFAGVPGRNSISLRTYLGDLGLVPEDLPADLRPERVSAGCPRARAVAEHVAADRRLRAKVQKHAAAARREFFAYMAQALEEVPESAPVCLVDVGWGGSIQKILDRAGAFGGRPVTGLYLALNDRAFRAGPEEIACGGYLVDGFGDHPLAPAVLRYVELVEQVCTPPVGSTLRYAGGRPEFQPELIPAEQRAQIDAVQDGIRDVLRIAPPAENADAARRTAWSILMRLALKPEEEEILAFRHWLHDNSHAHTCEPLCPPELQRAHEYMTPRQILDGDFGAYYWPLGAGGSVVEQLLSTTAYLVAPDDLAAFETETDIAGEVAFADAEGARATRPLGPLSCNAQRRFLARAAVEAEADILHVELHARRSEFEIAFVTVIYERDGARAFAEIAARDLAHVWPAPPADVAVLHEPDLRRAAFSVSTAPFGADRIVGLWIAGTWLGAHAPGALPAARPRAARAGPDVVRAWIDSFEPAPAPAEAGGRAGGHRVALSGWAYLTDSSRAADRVNVVAAEGTRWLGRWQAAQVRRADLEEAFGTEISGKAGFNALLELDVQDLEGVSFYLELQAGDETLLHQIRPVQAAEPGRETADA